MTERPHEQSRAEVEAVVPQRGDRTRWGWVGMLLGLGLVVGVGAYVLWPKRVVDPAESVESLRRGVDMQLQQRQWDKAAALLDRIEQRGWTETQDRIRRGSVELGRGNLEAVRSLAAEIPPEGPEGARAKLLLGQVALREGLMVPAERELRQALEMDEGLIQARRELIYIYGMRLQREPLQEQFRELSKLTALNWDEMFLWNISRGNDWDASEHVELLERFLTNDPDDRATRLAVAHSLGVLGGINESLEVLEPLSDSDAEVRAARVRLLLKRGDTQTVDKLLADTSVDSADLDRLRGQVALSRRDAEAAVKWYRRALEREPEQREGIAGMGRAYQLAREPEKAAPFLQAAQKHDQLSALLARAGSSDARNDPKLPLQLAEACEAVGRLAEAKAWCRYAIKRDPVNPEAQKLMYRLEHSKDAEARVGVEGSGWEINGAVEAPGA